MNITIAVNRSVFLALWLQSKNFQNKRDPVCVGPVRGRGHTLDSWVIVIVVNYVRAYVYIYIYIYIYMCMCVCVCVCVSVCVNTHLIDCGDLTTKVRVSLIVQATLWGPKTKH